MARGAAVERRQVTFDECWSILQEEAVNKMIRKFEANEKQPSHEFFTSEEFIGFYTLVYNLCCSKNSNTDIQVKLYEQYKRTFEDYILSKVLPCLREQSNENLLREFLRRWRNHKVMTRFLSHFLIYFERHYISRSNLPSLVDASHQIFYNLVYVEVKDRVRDTITSLIDREQIDDATVKQVLDFCDKIRGGDASKNYAKDIEEAITEAATTSRLKCLRL